MPLIITAAFLHFLATMSPGPDFIICARNSLTYSRRVGIWTALGIAFGILVHIAYCVAGIALVISQSIVFFSILKGLGAAYLIYIGIQSWRARHTTLIIDTGKSKQVISPLWAMRIGFFTNVLNPKATLFFLSLFTLVISPETPQSLLQIMSVIFFIETFLWFGFVATVLTIPRVRRVFERFQGFFNKFFGGALVILGIKVATTE